MSGRGGGGEEGLLLKRNSRLLLPSAIELSNRNSGGDTRASVLIAVFTIILFVSTMYLSFPQTLTKYQGRMIFHVNRQRIHMKREALFSSKDKSKININKQSVVCSHFRLAL